MCHLRILNSQKGGTRWKILEIKPRAAALFSATQCRLDWRINANELCSSKLTTREWWELENSISHHFVPRVDKAKLNFETTRGCSDRKFLRWTERGDGDSKFAAEFPQQGNDVPTNDHKANEEKLDEDQRHHTEHPAVRRASHQSDSVNSGSQSEFPNHTGDRLQTFHENVLESLRREPGVLEHGDPDRTSGRDTQMVPRREHEVKHGLRVHGQLRRFHHHALDFEIHTVHQYLSRTSVLRRRDTEENHYTEGCSVDLVLVHHIDRHWTPHIRLFRRGHGGHLRVVHDYVHRYAHADVDRYRRFDYLRAVHIERDRGIVEDEGVEAICSTGWVIIGNCEIERKIYNNVEHVYCLLEIWKFERSSKKCEIKTEELHFDFKWIDFVSIWKK